MSFPLLQHLVRFLNTLDGRDQAAKFVQYGSRATMFYMREADPKSVTATQFEALYKGTSTSRKVFRILKWLKEYQAAIDAFKQKDWRIRSLRIVQHMCLAGYLFCDNVVWLKKIKVIDWDIKPMQRMSGKLWAIGMACCFAADYMEVQKMQQDLASLKVGTAEDGVGMVESKASESSAAIAKLETQIGDKQRNMIKSVCNFMVASNAATWVEAVRGTPLTDGVIGLCGVVGASMNIYKYWRKTAK